MGVLPSVRASSEWSASKDLESSDDNYTLFKEPLITRSALRERRP